MGQFYSWHSSSLWVMLAVQVSLGLILLELMHHKVLPVLPNKTKQLLSTTLKSLNLFSSDNYWSHSEIKHIWIISNAIVFDLFFRHCRRSHEFLERILNMEQLPFCWNFRCIGQKECQGFSVLYVDSPEILNFWPRYVFMSRSI